MNKWMNKWIENEWINERMNKWMNKWINHTHAHTHKWKCTYQNNTKECFRTFLCLSCSFHFEKRFLPYHRLLPLPLPLLHHHHHHQFQVCQMTTYEAWIYRIRGSNRHNDSQSQSFVWASEWDREGGKKNRRKRKRGSEWW